jgi:glucose-1-phosphate thymidylyltransferase
MRGIILAGGTGSRLWPATMAVSKQLLPIYDKPLIYYPLSTLMSNGIREIMIVTTPEDSSSFLKVLGDGSEFGINISFAIQEKPRGIAEAFIIAEDFIKQDSCCSLVLGDNIFYGPNMNEIIPRSIGVEDCQILGYKVADPSQYGVVEIDKDGKVIAIEEKPKKPKSKIAVPGLYFFGKSVIDASKSIVPSKRGELEITSVIQKYIDSKKINISILPEGTAWLDSGTFSSLHDAGSYVRVIEERQGIKIGCPEEISWRNGWISDDDLQKRADMLIKSGYGSYLKKILESKK